jgi:hypothetical protein
MTDFRRGVVQKILDDQNNLGVRADSKALAFLTTLGIFTAFFIAFAKDIEADYFCIALLAIYFICAILGVWNIIMTINPRIGQHNPQDKTCDPEAYKAAFFAEICKFAALQDYKTSLEALLKDEETVINVYARQIFEVSIVIAEKYKRIRRAVYFVITALFTEFVLIAYLFVLNSFQSGV